MYRLDPHQKTSVEFAILHAYSILALDMGLGKTLVALDVWKRLGGNCLVVCPAYLILNWRDEIHKFLGEDVLITPIRKGSEIYYIFDSDIVLISYDLAQKTEQIFEWADMVFLDEGQELKSMKAKRTEYIHRVIFENSIKRLHILTGTPIKNRVEEYYSLLALMNYQPTKENPEFLKRFPDSITFADYFSFRQEFKMSINNKWVTIVKWTGVRRVPELKKYLAGHYIRFNSKDVLKLEEPRYKDVLISDAPDKALLNEFNKYYEEEDNQGVGSSKKSEAALKKVPFTVRYVTDLLEQIDCVVIYTDHIESCKALAAAFGVPAITGEMPPSKRVEIGKRFQAGEFKVLAATIGAFSTGVTLIRASHLVLNDPSWVPGNIKQAIYRIHRRGQERNCTIHRILGSPQDRKILHSLDSKMATIDKIV